MVVFEGLSGVLADVGEAQGLEGMPLGVNLGEVVDDLDMAMVDEFVRLHNLIRSVPITLHKRSRIARSLNRGVCLAAAIPWRPSFGRRAAKVVVGGLLFVQFLITVRIEC